MDPDCLFCKIAAGDVPCHKLYEDEHVLAFLDIFPLSPGHCLLIPKRHAPQLHDLPEQDAAALGSVLPRLARAVRLATDAPAYNVLQNNGAPAGQEVMHVHVHLIPKPTPEPGVPRTAGPPGSGLGIHWPAGKLDPDQAQTLIKKITAALT